MDLSLWSAHADNGKRQESRDTSQTDTSNTSSRSTSVVSPMNVHAWTVDDVTTWLGAYSLTHCADTFKENRITGDVLLDIGRDDLAEMGICALGDRMRLVKAIEQLRVDTQQVVGGADMCTLDFLFLGSSPLVMASADDGQAKPLELIDLEAEHHAINKALVDVGRACRFQFEFATLRRLTWAVLQRSCCVLIFSGHTLPDGTWLLETDIGEALAFDPRELFQRNGQNALSQAQHELTRPQRESIPVGQEPELEAELASSPGQSDWKLPSATALSSQACAPHGICLRLVVLCSCHSGIPASLFIDAGVAHVIAVERSETVLDVSARVFVQSLCHSLLVGNTIQNAFKHAQWLVKHNECLHTSGYRATASKEAQKFVLLPESANHAKVLFPSQARGPATDCSAQRPPVQFPRTRLDLTVMRQADVWRVLCALRRHRFVQVLGPPGIGKRTLVCLVAHYVWQRHLFPNGIHYVHVDDLRWIVALDWSFRRLLPHGGVGDDASDASASSKAARTAAASWQLHHQLFLEQRLSLPGFQLLILDGCHGLYQKCRGAFLQWLQRLLEENPSLQVLITARAPIHRAPGPRGQEGREASRGEDALEEGIVEISELPQVEAMRLLRWRCQVLPEAAPFLEDYGPRLVDLCGRFPMALCICARWLIAQLPRTDPRRLVEAMEDERRRLEILQPCALVFDAAISALPDVLQASLLSLSTLHGAFSADIAAAVWAVELSEAEFRLGALRDQHLLEVAGGSLPGSLPAGMLGFAPTEADPMLHRVQSLLRLHLRRRAGEPLSAASRSGAASLPADPACAAQLLAGYAARVASAAVRWEEFPNVQMVLDLAGATTSFLILLWAVRSVAWVHTWLGADRRMKLYERALAVLAALLAKEEGGASARVTCATSSDAAPGSSIGVAGASIAMPAGVSQAQGLLAAVPSDAFLASPAADRVDIGRIQASLQCMIHASQPHRDDEPWESQRDGVFFDGSTIDSADVWGTAIHGPAELQLQPGGELDKHTLPLVTKSHATLAALVEALSNSCTIHHWICEALIELAAATRQSNAARALRLAHCAAARLAQQPASLAACECGNDEAAGLPPRARDLDAKAWLLFAEALMEFSLANLALRGMVATELTRDLLDLAMDIGQRTDPMGVQHLRALQLAAVHALASERDPCKSERLHKRCLELKLQKLNTWQHPEIADSLGDCGVLCHILGDLSHAESMLRTALGVWKQLLDYGQPRLAAAMVDLANLLVAKEQWADAEELYRQTITILREARGGSQQLYQAMSRLAQLLELSGKPEMALPILRECTAGIKRALGSGDNLAVAAVSHSLARCLMDVHTSSTQQSSSKIQDARELLEQASLTYRELLPRSSPSALALQRSLARCYVALMEPDRAAPILEEALALMEELGSYSVKELGKLHFLLGRTRLLQSQVDESRYHLEWVLRRPAAADALDAADRMAAEALVSHDGKLAVEGLEEKAPPTLLTPPGEGQFRACIEEPQVEPEAACAGPASGTAGDGGHLWFPDVEESSLSVLNRAQYLLAGRTKAYLGVLPNSLGSHCSSAATGLPADTRNAHLAVAKGLADLGAVVARMEQECIRMPGGVARLKAA